MVVCAAVVFAIEAAVTILVDFVLGSVALAAALARVIRLGGDSMADWGLADEPKAT